MRYSTLADWLAWQETLHPAKIDLGLERVRAVLQRMGLEHPAYTVVTVGGTNGKGSCTAMLEAILRAAGYRVGAYTSPHLLRYNERVRVNGAMADDETLCAAFARVDEARGGVSLTYFEFGTLAALDIFSRAGLDAAILEVGMGGRLDAVNILDADAAVVTTVDIDHTAWLGADREQIGREKAGIFRASRPAVYGDVDPPSSVAGHARALGAELYCLGRDFGFEREAAGWSWWGRCLDTPSLPSGSADAAVPLSPVSAGLFLPAGDGEMMRSSTAISPRRRRALPMPRLRGPYQLKNAAAAIAALELLRSRLPVGQQALRLGLIAAELPGRLQVLDEQGLRICDVAHNPQAAAALAEGLRSLPCRGKTHAVVAMLADKDAGGAARALSGTIDIWHVAGLTCERGAAARQLAPQIRAAAGAAAVYQYAAVSEALTGAARAAGSADRIVVFGSFHTVAEALEPRNSAWRQAGAARRDEVVSAG